MFARELRWGGVVFGLVLASGLLALGGNAVAQGVAGLSAGPWQQNSPYVGDYLCSVCHATPEYASYKQHGHPWMSVHTGGRTPPAGLFAPVGLPLPSLPTNLQWSQVQDIVANFKDTTTGFFVMTDGTRQSASTGPAKLPGSLMPNTCNYCHNTAGNFFGNQLFPGMTAPSKIQASWQLSGIQCEECHGPGPTMQVPSGASGNALCRDCHSSGDIVPAAMATSQYRIPFSTTAMQFSNHHPEGDEYRRSPHQNNGCYSCHDPHKSVWHDDGGVLFASANGVGKMCTHCHTEQVSGGMGATGANLDCTDCHMPEISAGGTRAAHIFKINATPLAASANVITQKSTSGTPTVYWKNSDGTTSPNGTSFLTLDLVCTQCHGKMMTLAQMSNAAKYIHIPPAMISLTANGSGSLIIVKRTTPVSVNFSLKPGPKAGMKASFWVMCQGPKGLTSWNGKKWVPGQVPWFRSATMVNLPNVNVLRGTLPLQGSYTYWVAIYPTDGSSNVATVPVLVTR
jgi:hypothetical protein